MAIKTILIIDDSEADQFFAKTTIEFYDSEIEVTQAFDGKEALQILSNAEKQPDIIFVDLNMPVMNGIDFLTHYTKEGFGGSTIFMLTSSDLPKDVKESTAYECVRRYMIKPLKEHDLIDISKLLAS